ncbi:adenylyl-sulfate kinase [Kribbella sp. ALI-6-A]|uniref:adenylyl-sulfate kinase n=1 Tax=Kribbella sp. ALI-6-A TaxID=1933817 RepID=UPI001EDB0B9E|nr:adenylyl-sulfate kinase [Kribbella sp. ALI-6-A]
MVADLWLAGHGIRPPFAVLGHDAAGEPPLAGRVRIPATADEIGRALAAGALTIADSESTPVAALTDLTSPRDPADGGWIEGRLVELEPLAVPARSGPGRVVVVPQRPVTSADLQDIADAGIDDVVLVLPSAGATPDGVPAATLRECLVEAVPDSFAQITLPVSWRGNEADEALAAAVAIGLDATRLLRLRPASEFEATGPNPTAGPDRHRGTADTGDKRWLEALAEVRQAIDTIAVVDDPVLNRALPTLARWRPPRRERGLVVFFTGLSGSGKSTLAKSLTEELTSQAGRAVTLLDGDVVRRMLSSGLGFDRAGRDLNVRRIGFVAAEVARHGGIAVCAPIAPYADSRAAVRSMVEAVGDLVLVHVATPLAECERRDTKGLYRKARAGVVTQFTGISDPYDEPLDADLRLDTSAVSPAESLAELTGYLAAGGWIPSAQPDRTVGPAPAGPVTGG